MRARANLTVDNCNWDSYDGGSPEEGPSTLLPGVVVMPDAHLVASNSFARVKCDSAEVQYPVLVL